MTPYAAELTRAMSMLAADPRTIFLGQAVRYPGTAMSTTLADVPMDKRIEFPVAEQMQMGASIGLARQGFVPVTIFTRWNFLLLAADALVNHLDKMGGQVIVRVGVGSEKPMHPGAQHVGDFTEAFRLMCRNIPIVRLERKEDIVPAYVNALGRRSPSVLVEISDLCNA